MDMAKAAGDFDGDGKSDIVFQNIDDGACYIWEMNGLNLKSGGYGSSYGDVGWKTGKDWQVKATGDFNNDGKSDIVFQNVKDGACYIWEMDGLNFRSGGYGDSYGDVGKSKGADWVVKATGDFDGDGKSDILFQNVTDGACHIWLMDGLNLKKDGSGDVGWKPGANWLVKSTGDYDGDGKTDIFLQNVDDGACYIWELDGLALKSGGYGGSYGDVGWKAGADWHALA